MSNKKASTNFKSDSAINVKDLSKPKIGKSSKAVEEQPQLTSTSHESLTSPTENTAVCSDKVSRKSKMSTTVPSKAPKQRKHSHLANESEEVRQLTTGGNAPATVTVEEDHSKAVVNEKINVKNDTEKYIDVKNVEIKLEHSVDELWNAKVETQNSLCRLAYVLNMNFPESNMKFIAKMVGEMGGDGEGEIDNRKGLTKNPTVINEVIKKMRDQNVTFREEFEGQHAWATNLYVEEEGRQRNTIPSFTIDPDAPWVPSSEKDVPKKLKTLFNCLKGKFAKLTKNKEMSGSASIPLWNFRDAGGKGKESDLLYPAVIAYLLYEQTLKERTQTVLEVCDLISPQTNQSEITETGAQSTHTNSAKLSAARALLNSNRQQKHVSPTKTALATAMTTMASAHVAIAKQRFAQGIHDQKYQKFKRDAEMLASLPLPDHLKSEQALKLWNEYRSAMESSSMELPEFDMEMPKAANTVPSSSSSSAAYRTLYHLKMCLLVRCSPICTACLLSPVSFSI
jgi:hypothetical protein